MRMCFVSLSGEENAVDCRKVIVRLKDNEFKVHC